MYLRRSAVLLALTPVLALGHALVPGAALVPLALALAAKELITMTKVTTMGLPMERSSTPATRTVARIPISPTRMVATAPLMPRAASADC